MGTHKLYRPGDKVRVIGGTHYGRVGKIQSLGHVLYRSPRGVLVSKEDLLAQGFEIKKNSKGFLIVGKDSYAPAKVAYYVLVDKKEFPVLVSTHALEEI